MRAQDALDRYASVCGPARAPQHLAVVRRYLAWGGTGDPAEWGRYVTYLRHHEGLSPATVAYHQRICRAFFRAVGLPVPKAVRLDEESHSERPAYHADWIRTLIGAAKTPPIDPLDRWIIALATTYGLRAVEIAAVSPHDVDLEQHRFYVHTAKHGATRWQWMPPAIRPWVHPALSRSSAIPICGVQRVHRALDHVAPVAGLERIARADLHGIRRGLVVALADAGVSDAAIIRFLRWSPAEGSSGARQLRRYRHPTVVIGGEAAADRAGSDQEDREVWDRHPFLSAWAEPPLA